MNNHCRISKVKFKDGRTLDILPKTRERNHQLMKDANRICSQHGEPIEGYLVIVWDDECGYSYGYHMGNMKMITPGLMPSWIKDILLREVIQNDLIYIDDPGDGA